MGLVQSNMNGDASENDFLKSLPAVEVFSYQCSPLSTSQGAEGHTVHHAALIMEADRQAGWAGFAEP